LATSYDEFKQLLRNRHYREAAFLAEKAAASGGSNAEFWLNQQAIAVLRMNRPQEALALAEQALAHNPAGYYSMLIRAEALFSMGDTTASLAGFREALNYPPVEERARKGVLDCLIKSRQFEEALAVIVNGSAGLAAMYSYKVKALSGLKRIDEAIDVCNEWLSRSVDDREALRLLCDLEVQRDGIAAVLSKYERMAKIPSRPPIYAELCAMLNRKAGNVNGEIVYYDKLSAKAASPFIMRRKAFALAKSGKESEAIPLFEEFLRSAPNDQYVNSAYIAAARRAGYLENAWKFYYELLGMFPDEKAVFGRIRKIAREMEQYKNGM
jgi:tetratricopeptide (TPR) repeat protein